MPKLSRRGISVVAVGCFGLVLSSCTAAEPKANTFHNAERPLVIAVATDRQDSTEQVVFGDLYEQAFWADGRSAVRDVLPHDSQEHAIARLGDTRAEMMIGCTGDLLAAFSPDMAEEIHAEIAAADDPEAARNDNRQRTYDALKSVLPSHLDAPDPSPAEGCEGPDTGLPQNIVPVFQKTALSRADRQTLNELGRSLTTEDIQEIVEAARDSGSVSAAVEDYYDGVGSFTGGGAQANEPAEARIDP